MEFNEMLQRLMDEAVAEGFVAGVNLLVRKNGEEVVYLESGYADREQQVPIQRDTIFRLYSMSKPITGAAAMLLVERGMLDLSAPVSKYIPAFAKQVLEDGNAPRRQVLIKDLLSMRSGLPYPSELHESGRASAKAFQALIDSLDTNTMSTVEFAAHLAEGSLHFEPGSEFMYGSSADVLGAVIEIASGMRFGEFLKKEFFEPLNMKDSGFYVPAEKQQRLTKVYEAADNELQEFRTNHLGIHYDLEVQPTYESGGAGLVSTLDDYARFAQMLLNGGMLDGVRVLSPKTVSLFTSGQLTTSQKEGFWQGWEHLSGYNYGNLMRIMEEPGLSYLVSTVGEYGWDGWLGAYFSNHPKEQITFFMMIQKRDAGTTEFTRRLRNAVLAELA